MSSTTDFIENTESFVRKKISETEKQIDTLKKSTRKASKIADFIKNIITALALVGIGSGYTKETELSVKKYVDKLIPLDISTSDNASPAERLEDSSISMLGGLLSTDPEAIVSFINTAADNYVLLLRQKHELLDEIKDIMLQLDSLVPSIDSSWYTVEFPNRIGSASSVLNDAISTMKDMSSRSYNGIVDIGGINKVSRDIDNSISYLSDDVNLEVVSDIGNLLNRLEELNNELVYLEKDCVNRHLGLITSKSTFIEAAHSNSSIFDFYRRSLNAAYPSLVSIRDQMDISVLKGVDSQIANRVHLWISELISMKSVLESSDVDYAEVISDPTSPLVVNLDKMILDVDIAGNPVSGKIVDSVNSVISQVKVKIGTDIPTGPISDNILKSIENIDNDNHVTDNVVLAIEVNRVDEVMSQVTDYLDMITSFSMDKMYDLILSFKWADIINYRNIAMTYAAAAKIAVDNMRAIYKKGFAMDRVLNIYYQVAGMYESTVSSSLTFEELELKAVDVLVNSKLPELRSMLASISRLDTMLESAPKKKEEDDKNDGS